MGKIVAFLYDNMADFEITLALQLVCQYTDNEVITVAFEKTPKTGRSGLVYQPQNTVKEALEWDDINGLIIPGGMNDEQRDELTELIQRLHSEQKLLAAICRGPSFFARAGVLNDALYTTTYSEDLVKEQGIEDPFNRANFRNEFVVLDQHFITAKGNAFVDFAVEILDRFDPCEKPEQKVDTKNYFKGLLD